MSLGEKVKQLREKLGINQKQLAEASGITQATISRIESGQVKELRSEALKRLASALEVTVDYLVDRTDSIGLRENRYILIPRYDVRASAGHGAFVSGEEILEILALRADWTKKALDIDPGDLALITIMGDSMEPTLKEGDLLLINTTVTKVVNDAIYAIGINDALMVKRIQQLTDGSLIVKSDNPAYKEQVIPKDQVEDLRIIGRLVWFGRRL